MTVTRRTVIAGLGALAGAAAGVAGYLARALPAAAAEPAAPLFDGYWRPRPDLRGFPDEVVVEWVPFDGIEEIRKKTGPIHEAMQRHLLPIDLLDRPNPYLDADYAERLITFT